MKIIALRMAGESKRLVDELNYWYEKVCTADFIADDPVQFPRRYKKREDIEIAAFLAAAIAWGAQVSTAQRCG